MDFSHEMRTVHCLVVQKYKLLRKSSAALNGFCFVLSAGAAHRLFAKSYYGPKFAQEFASAAHL